MDPRLRKKPLDFEKDRQNHFSEKIHRKRIVAKYRKEDFYHQRNAFACQEAYLYRLQFYTIHRKNIYCSDKVKYAHEKDAHTEKFFKILLISVICHFALEEILEVSE